MIGNHDAGIIRPRKIHHGWPAAALSSDTILSSTFQQQQQQQQRHIFNRGGGDGNNLPSQYQHPNDNDPIKQNKIHGKKINLRKSVVNQLEKYCENTTLHGLRYVGDSHLTFGERLFWFISFASAIIFAAYYITNIYDKWTSSPVIISFSPFDVDLRSIPFPTITICNMNQAKKIEAEKILREGSNIERKLLDDACGGNSTFNESETATWDDLKTFLVQVGSSCSDILQACYWGGDKIDCDELFNNDLTDEGLCCTFNRLPKDKLLRNAKDIAILNQTFPANIYDWSPEKGFSEMKPEDDLPKRPLGAGAHLGLSLIMDVDIDNYYCSSARSYGLKVLYSNPVESPKVADYGFFLNPGTETRIAIQPQLRESTDSLRNIPIRQRQCYFSNERPLQYYRVYTQYNCEQECQSNYTFENCNCIPYYLPKNRSITFCGKNDKFCVAKAKRDTEYSEGPGASCQCYPSCNSLRYTHSKSAANIAASVKKDLANRTLDYIFKNILIAHFYFFNAKFTKELKSELYGITEILSNVGGLLGLCLGFSFLSLVELVYFLSLRLVCHWCKQYAKIKEKRRTRPPVYPFIK